MATSTGKTVDQIRREYCSCVIAAFRTLQLYGVRADTPVEIDLEDLYVSLTMREPGRSAGQSLTEAGGSTGAIWWRLAQLGGLAGSVFQVLGEPGPASALGLASSVIEALSRPGAGSSPEGIEGQPGAQLESLATAIGETLPSPQGVTEVGDQGTGVSAMARRFLERLEPNMGSGPEGGLSAQPLERTRTIGEALQGAERLMVLGDPGSGKTTLLKYLALVFAGEQAGEQLGLEESRIPIFLRFWDYFSYVDGNQAHLNPEKIVAWIESQARSIGFRAPKGFFETALKEGECILLFDGLDEVPGLEDRGRIVRAVEALVHAYPQNRYVFSSRIQGYRSIPHFASGFAEAYVNDFTDEDVQAFARKWYLAVRGTLSSPLDQQRADQMSDDLLRAVTLSPKVRQLARNPLLLSTIALVHYNRVQLPERRAQLYDECTVFLLGFWDSSKGIQADEQIKQLLGEEFDRNAKRELLEPIAFWFHQQQSERFIAGEEALQARLAAELEQMTGEKNQDKLSQIAGLLLESARERSGLLIERENGSFAFSHLTFQEYLAARRLAYQPDCIDFVRSHLHESWWQEVILLIAGHLGGENNRWARGQLTELVNAIRNAGSEYEKYLKRDLFLAARCLADVGPMGIHGWLRDQIADELLDIHQRSGITLLRREALRHLLALRSETHNQELRRRCVERLKHGGWLDDTLVELSKSDEKMVEDLLGLLNDAHYEVRAAGIWALGQICDSDGRVVDALVARLEDRSYNVRAAAARVLGQCGKSDTQVINGLLGLSKLQSANRYRAAADARVAASSALGQLGQPDDLIIQTLNALLEDQSPQVRMNAATVLGKLDPSNESAINILMEALHDKNFVVRLNATNALAQLGQSNKRVVDVLLPLLQDAQSFVREGAAYVLGLTGQSDARVMDALLPLLQDGDPYSRHMAANAFSLMGQLDAPVVDALLPLLQDTESLVRRAAVYALGQSGQSGGQVVDALLPLLRDPESSVRSGVVNELAQIGQLDKSVMDALLPLLQDPDSLVRRGVVSAIAQIRQSDELVVDALLPLLQDPNSLVRSGAANAFARVGQSDDRVVDTLLPLLRDAESFVRGGVANALGKLGQSDERVVKALATSLENEEPPLVRTALLNALWTQVYGDPAGTQEMSSLSASEELLPTQSESAPPIFATLQTSSTPED